MPVSLFDAMRACSTAQELWYCDKSGTVCADKVSAADETGVEFANGEKRALRLVFSTQADAVALIA